MYCVWQVVKTPIIILNNPIHTHTWSAYRLQEIGMHLTSIYTDQKSCLSNRAFKQLHTREETVEPTYLLTYSMVQSPSWKANCFTASQEIPCISRNPKVHYRTHKRPLTVPILGQPNPVYIPKSHLLDIHPHIIHPSTPRSPQWSLPLRFPYKDPNAPFFSPIRASCPAHLILLDFITHTIFGEEYKSFRWRTAG